MLVSPLLRLSPTSLLSAVQPGSSKGVRDIGPGLELPESTSSCPHLLAVPLGKLLYVMCLSFFYYKWEIKIAPSLWVVVRIKSMIHLKILALSRCSVDVDYRYIKVE